MTAGILPAARILRAAPLPNESRGSATSLLSSAMMDLLSSGVVGRRTSNRQKSFTASITDAAASLAEVQLVTPARVSGTARPRSCRGAAAARRRSGGAPKQSVELDRVDHVFE